MAGAVIYIRVSDEEQQKRNVANLPTQEKKCRDRCNHNALPVLKVFCEEQSARNVDGRPEFQKLLEYCKLHRGNVSHVVVADLSRFARNTADQATAMARLENMSIALVSVDEPHIDKTAAGKLSANILGAVNQFYSDNLSERVRYRMSECVKAGRWVWKAPLGYRNAPVDGTKNIVQDPDRAPLMRKAFELLATGSYTKESVLRQINAMGLRTEKGAELTPQSFSQYIKNPLYMGWIVSGQNRLKGSFEPIVSEELFNAVQEALDGRNRSVSHKRVNEDFPLRGFVRCSHCEQTLTAGWSKGRHKKYAYYRCYKTKCKEVNIRREELEMHFHRLLGMIQPTTELIAKLPDIARSTWEIRKKRIEDEKRTLQTRLNENKSLNHKAVEAHLKGTLAAADMEQFKEANNKSIAQIEEQLKSLQSEAFTMESLIADAREDVLNVVKTWTEADLARKQEIQMALFPDGLVFSPETLFFEPRNHTLMQSVREMWEEMIQGGGPARI
jgi:site-specific DNA recombinase